MSESNLKLYVELMNLVENNESDVFYFQDFDLDGKKYRIFNYRLSSYTDFMKPSALEIRGIMFQVDGQGRFIRLAARPMQKFFNLNENPMTMNLDLSQVDTVELKADGSLMSTFSHNGTLRLKSRGSLFSEQAIDAMKWLESQPQFQRGLHFMDALSWTINLEWCAPHNRIVIGYDKPHLKVLNARNRDTGQYLDRPTLEDVFGSHVIERVHLFDLDVPTFVKNIPALLDDIEGYVARIGDLWFKIKTEKYMSLHHAKDSINNPRRLFEAVVDEGVDDLRSMFSHDALAIKQIDEMQAKVTKLYNSMVREVVDFYEENKGLDRKNFAIKGQNQDELTPMYFGLAMQRYTGKEVNYKAFIKSRYKELGFKDEKVVTE